MQIRSNISFYYKQLKILPSETEFANHQQNVQPVVSTTFVNSIDLNKVEETESTILNNSVSIFFIHLFYFINYVVFS